MFTFRSFPSTPWRLNFHPPFPLFTLFLAVTGWKQNIQKWVFSSLCSAAIQAAQEMQWGEVQHVEVVITPLWPGGGTNVCVQEHWEPQWYQETVCLPKDFYSLTSSGSRREKGKANQASSRRDRQWGHSLSEVMWEGLDPVVKFWVMYLSREQSDFWLTPEDFWSWECTLSSVYTCPALCMVWY